MIHPLVCEEDWMEWLAAVPEWSGLGQSAVVVVPHPDDEVLGIGGLIASLRLQELDVTILAVTDGEHAYEKAETLAAVRREEQVASLGFLNVPAAKIIRFGLPDSDVSSFEAVLTERILPFCSTDVTIFTPWVHDYHPDHEACGRAAERAAKVTGTPLVSYLFWAWHFRTSADMKGLPLRRFPLDDSLLEAKAKALECHRSQLEWKTGTPVLYEPLLAPSRRPFETFIIS